MADAAKARQIATFRQGQAKDKAHAARGSRLTLESLQAQLSEEGSKDLPIIIKADVQGSAEVLADTLAKLSDAKTKIKIIHSAVGAINESDVLLATASNAIIIGFNVRPDRNAADVAEREKVDIRQHSVIYHVTDEIKKAMTGLLEPTFKETRIGSAQVRETFKVPKIGTIAGCMVTDGRITRQGDAQARLLRDNVVVWEGKLASLKRFKDDVSEVKAGLRVRHGPAELQRCQSRRRDRSVPDGARRAAGLRNGGRDGSFAPRRADSGTGSRGGQPDAGHRGSRSGCRPRHGDPHQGHRRPLPRARLLDDHRRRRRAHQNRRRRWSARPGSCATCWPSGSRLRRVPEVKFIFDQSVGGAGSHRADHPGDPR